MAATDPTPPVPAGPAFMLPGVNLFASGEYRGKPWPPAVLRMIAANARRLGPDGRKLLIPPAVLGHEEEQEWLDRTDLPAAGWVDPASVHVVPDPDHPGELILKGDVVNIPPEVEARLSSGEYRFGSAEIYDDFKDDFGREHGQALRRFALLGGEVPQVKRLGALPKVVPMQATRQFSELRPGVVIRERRVSENGTVHTYAETTVMDRTGMIAAIQAAMPNLSAAFLEALSDEQLAELAKSVQAPEPAAAEVPVAPSGLMADMPREDLVAALTELGQDPASLEGMSDEELQALYDELDPEDAEAEPAEEEPAEEEEPDTEDMADPATMAPADMIAELTAMGQDPAALQGMPEEELRALYGELTGAATASAPVPAANAMGGAKKPVKPYGGGTVESALPWSPTKFTERNRGRAMPATVESRRLLKNMKKLNQFAEREARRAVQQSQVRKARDVESFCKDLVRDGRATPAQVATTIKPLLLFCDDTHAVHRFTEGKVTRKLTAYELKKAELAKLPKIVHFGERFGDAGPTDGESEVAKVREFANTLSEAALKAGNYKSRENFVEKFSEARQKDSSLTAKKYLGI